MVQKSRVLYNIQKVLRTKKIVIFCKVFILQVWFWYNNIQSWKKSYKLVEFLPLQGASYLRNNPLSDLHVLMSIINQTDQARKVNFKITKKPF